MDREKRRSIALSILVVLVILFSVIYFFWGTLINRGTIKITARAPFSVELLGGKVFECPSSPCEITQRSGYVDILIEKEGHETVLNTVDVKLWRTVDLNIKFNLIPVLSRVGALPETKPQPEYLLVPDQLNGMQKLVNAADQKQTAIVYFQNQIDSAKIIGSDKFVLIIPATGPAYKISTVEKTRDQLNVTRLSDIRDGKWSQDGNYFVFSRIDSTGLWLIGDFPETKQLAVYAAINQVEWIYDESLLFITDQKSVAAPDLDRYGYRYTALENTISTEGYTFGIYHPQTDTYSEIETFSELPQLPSTLITTSNGQNIYFSIGEETYKLPLR